jgi:hypothetical protein
MGTNLKMLSEGECNYYYDVTPVRMELEECIHFHTDNIRLIWTVKEFAQLFPFFQQAKDKLDELGWPNQSTGMQRLAGGDLKQKSMQHNRWAIEFTKSRDGWIHIHLGNLRVLLPLKDFEILFSMFREASIEFYEKVKTTINLNDENVGYPPHVITQYLPWLMKYKECWMDREDADPTSVGRLRAEVKKYTRHPKGKNVTFEDIQRKMDEPYIPVSGKIPEELDKEYLFAVYESIREWGYADGPFYGELVPAVRFKNGQIRIRAAHRAAALVALGYGEIDVFLTDIEE